MNLPLSAYAKMGRYDNSYKLNNIFDTRCIDMTDIFFLKSPLVSAFSFVQILNNGSQLNLKSENSRHIFISYIKRKI